MRCFSIAATAAALVIVLGAFQAGAVPFPFTVTDWTSTSCDDQGCEGAQISLKVEDLGAGRFRVTQGLNLSLYNPGAEAPMSLVQAVGFKAVTNVTNVLSFSAPAGAGSWDMPLIRSNTTGQGCRGNGNGKICAAENTGGVAFSNLPTDGDGWSYWTYIVEGSGVLSEEDQHYGLDYGPGNGRLISASPGAKIPEPSAALVFGLGALVVGRATRRGTSQ